MKHQTICCVCNRVLTDGSVRLEAALFVDLPTPKMTETTVYAHCEPCYERIMELNDEQTN